MIIEQTTIGERGQAVIPKSIRDRMPAPKGTVFSVALIDENTIVMKRIDRKKLLAEFNALRAKIQAEIPKPISEQEIVDEIKRIRKLKNRD